jgi:hypothetical protein
MSLEVPGPGVAIHVGRADIEHLASYVRGFLDRETTLSEKRGVPREDDAFWDWLWDQGEFPSQGWARNCLEKCEGDNEQALARFFGLLHTFLLERRPAWFVEFNAIPRPSSIRNGFGQPRSFDIRLPHHIEAVGPSRAL